MWHIKWNHIYSSNNFLSLLFTFPRQPIQSFPLANASVNVHIFWFSVLFFLPSNIILISFLLSFFAALPTSSLFCFFHASLKLAKLITVVFPSENLMNLVTVEVWRHGKRVVWIFHLCILIKTLFFSVCVWRGLRAVCEATESAQHHGCISLLAARTVLSPGILWLTTTENVARSTLCAPSGNLI